MEKLNEVDEMNEEKKYSREIKKARGRHVLIFLRKGTCYMKVDFLGLECLLEYGSHMLAAFVIYGRITLTNF